MNSRVHAVLTTVAAACLAASCSSNSQPMPVPETHTAAPTPTLQFSPRGAQELEVGEPAGVRTGGEGPTVATFKLAAITPDVQCTEDWAASNKPDNGRWILMDFDVQTGDSNVIPDVLAKTDFYSVSEDGTIGEVGKSQGDECLEDVSWFGVEDAKPNAKYRVALLMDVADDATVIGYDGPSGASWEWSIPVASR